MKKSLTLVALASICSSLWATDLTVTSPNGRINVTVSDNDGKPSYKVTLDNVTFLDNSPLGIVTSVGDYSKDLTLKENAERNTISQNYQLKTIKQSNVQYNANELICTFAQNGNDVCKVTFRVSDKDVAFRYTISPNRKTYSCYVTQECSGFLLPEGTTTFLCPQSPAMKGFANTSPSYETFYTPDDTMGKNGDGYGYTFPCLFRNNDKGWVLISETGTRGNYCGCRLIGGNGALYTIGLPQETELNSLASPYPGLMLPASTPWRTITLGTSLEHIMETTVAFDLVEPLYQPSKEYTYTKGSWSWIIGMDPSTNYNTQKQYIDFSAAMNWQTVLVDALWDTQIGRDKIEELAKYGKTKGVDLFLWYNSNGYWNNAPQSPRGYMHTAIERRKEMKWMQSIGIKGIKVDFFGGDKQPSMQLYEDILTDANDFGLQVIFHGCTLPRGWERMYPNYVASEAVLASENLNFGQSACDTEAFCATLHPFIRNTVGSMDFGGSALNKYYNAKNEPRGSKRITSDVFALATAVMFQSSVQHFAMAPNNLTDAPAWAVEFMKNVPTTWDEVQYIDGYPGKYVILARRHGDKWYIAGVNAQSETLKLNITLPMFDKGSEVTLYADDSTLNGSTSKVKVNKKQQLKITIPQHGGVVVTK